MSLFDRIFTSQDANYRNARRRAASILEDPKRLRKLLASSAEKIKQLRNDTESIEKLKQIIPTLNRMIRAYINGEYRKVPWKSLLLITTGILYFVSPLDFIPDFIPVAGFLDDITIILWILNAVKGDVEDYEEWENTYAKITE